MRGVLKLFAVLAITSGAFLSVQRQAWGDLAQEVPGGNGAWALRIITTGGFDGRGRGNVTVTSVGDLACDLAPGCGRKLSGGNLQPIARLIESFDISKWLSTPTIDTSICNDCYTTQAIVARRENGNVVFAVFTWTDVSQNRAPQEVIRLAELALSTARARN